MSTTTTTKTKTALTTTTLIGMPSGTGAAADSEKDSYPGWAGTGTGHMTADETQRRIQELETQVQFFKMQSTGAAAKLTEYDHEVRRLRSQANYCTPRTSRSSQSSALSNDIDKSLSPTQLPMSNGGGHAPPQPQPQTQTSRLFNLTSLFPYGRRPSATPPVPPSPAPIAPQVSAIPAHYPPGPGPEETMQLQNALNREQTLRKAAENQLSQANMELEDLTAQLFSQANEMVAQERKARAKLEERVAVLERRDVEKRKRLDRLEKSMQRVERLRSLIG